MKEYTCSICGRQYSELDKYIECVAECGKKIKENKKNEEINAAFNRVRQAEKYFKEQKDSFKKKFPEAYEFTFGKDSAKETVSDVNSIYISYEKIGTNEPKTTVKVNGKGTSADKYKKTLFADPNVKYIAELLGVVN